MLGRHWPIAGAVGIVSQFVIKRSGICGTQVSSRNTGEQLHSASGSKVKKSDFRWNRPEDKPGPSKAQTPQDIAKLGE
jgi:hypothetical protein